MKDNYIGWISLAAFTIILFVQEGFLIGCFAFLVFLKLELISDTQKNILKALVVSAKFNEKITRLVSSLIKKENQDGK